VLYGQLSCPFFCVVIAPDPERFFIDDEVGVQVFPL
jgi:hypothetical protein